MDLSNIKAVAFDAFGTLVDLGEKRRPFLRLADAALSMPMRSPMTEHMDLAGMAALCGLSISEDELAALTSDLHCELASIRPYPETIDVLKGVRNQGLRTAVASNLAMPYAAPLHEQLGSLLDVFCLSFEVGAMKPHRDFYAALCQLLQLNASEILMVGDTWRCDYAGATAAGLKALHLDRRGIAEGDQAPMSVTDLLGIFDARGFPKC